MIRGREDPISEAMGLPHACILTPPTLEFSLVCLLVLHVSIPDSLITEVLGLIKIVKKREKQVNDSQPEIHISNQKVHELFSLFQI